MSLKLHFRDVLVGFEKFSFTEEQLERSKFDLALAQQDLKTCKACRGGNCKAVANTQTYTPPGSSQSMNYYGDVCYYFALHKGDCETCKMPMFRLFECPGWTDRLKNIEESVLSKMDRGVS